MIGHLNFSRTLLLLILAAWPLAFAHEAAAQPTASAAYVPRGTRPLPGLAPGLQVTDLGKSGRTYRINLKKGDEIMSGLTEFAEKYRIKNAHFSGLGAINKGVFGWSDPADTRGQKRIELNQEAEIVSLTGNISLNAEGRPAVHAHGSVSFADGSVKGGHWWEAYVSIIAVVYVTEAEGVAEPAK